MAEGEGGVRNILITVVTGVITAMGTIGVASMSGFFDVEKTNAASKGTIDLERLKFSNELVKGALLTTNPANSLLFYADIGLLSGISVDNVKSYAEKETARLKAGGAGTSLLPSFDTTTRNLWLDRNLLASFAPKAQPEVVDALVSTGNYLLQGFGITASANRLAMFLATIATETSGFTILVENANFSKARLLQVFPAKFDDKTAESYADRPEAILNYVYGGRLGNGPEASGDGWRFRGRGMLFITGRDAYARLSQQAGIDLLTNSDILANPHVSLLVAALYWHNAGCNELADAGDLAAVTRKINGVAMLGLEERKKYFDLGLKLLRGQATAAQ
jgi:putative chitinase